MGLFLILVLGMGEMPAQAALAIAPQTDQAGAAVDTSPAALDQLLAPVALYPDALLMQVLAASVNSQEVLDAGNWLLENKSLEGAQLDSAAKAVGFGAAMTALLHFPDVVDMMCTELDWTQQLGATFSANQAAVLASVQRLRAQAQQAGSLQSTPQQQVITQQDNGHQVIVIQPANPQVVYVPQYDPQVVYAAGPGASLISFGLGMAVGALFLNTNNYYYPRWGYGSVYFGGNPWYASRYAYRPIYGAHYRRAIGYRPPANYPYHRPNYNNHYFNNYRPGGNQGNRPGSGNNPGNRPGNGNNPGNRPGNGGNNNNRPGYNGGSQGNRPGTPPANGGNRPGNGNGYNKPGAPGGTTRPTPGNTRPVAGGGGKPGNGAGNGGGNGGARPGNATRPAPDRGYTKPATRPAPQPPGRPAGGQQRPSTPTARPAPMQQQRPAAQGRPAPGLTPSGSGRATNAASQRGAASTGGRRSK